MIRHQNADAMVLASARMRGIPPWRSAILNIIRGVNASHKRIGHFFCVHARTGHCTHFFVCMLGKLLDAMMHMDPIGWRLALTCPMPEKSGCMKT
jgi:hypothetical protein